MSWPEKLLSPVLSSWPLIVVAVWGVWVARGTLKVIARQTTHLQNSVAAIIAENRPWLLIPSGQSGNGIQEPLLVPVEENMGQRMTHCIFFTKNYGKTPGKIFASKAEMQIGDSPTQPPDASVYDMQEAAHNFIIFPPGEQVASEADLAPISFIKEVDRDKILNKGKFLWLCGFLKYRDTFERENAPEHETRFCYLYETRLNSPKPFWRLAGPSEYNRAT
jgi:hypothetical protein